MISAGVTISQSISTVKCLQEEYIPNWVVKQADWSLFSQLAIIEETPFPTDGG
jgi:hypothetical protein